MHTFATLPVRHCIQPFPAVSGQDFCSCCHESSEQFSPRLTKSRLITFPVQAVAEYIVIWTVRKRRIVICELYKLRRLEIFLYLFITYGKKRPVGQRSRTVTQLSALVTARRQQRLGDTVWSVSNAAGLSEASTGRVEAPATAIARCQQLQLAALVAELEGEGDAFTNV